MAKTNTDRLYAEMAAGQEVAKDFEDKNLAEEQHNENLKRLSEQESIPEPQPDERVGSSLNRSLSENRAKANPSTSDRINNVSALGKSLIEQFNAYTQKASPRRIQSDDEFNRVQEDLVRLVQTTVNLDDNSDFIGVMTHLLLLVEKNTNNVFDRELILRNWRNLNYSDGVLMKAADFIMMIIQFADPLGRKVIAGRFPIAKSAQLASPAKQERLIQFMRRISGQ